MAKQVKAAAKAAQPASENAEDAVTLLGADHRKVESLFQQYESVSKSPLKVDVAHKIAIELSVHSMIEEEIFYPACRAAEVDHSSIDEAQVEHDGVKILAKELLTHRPEDEFYDAKVTVLRDYVEHHVREEEKPEDGIFAAAKKAGVDMEELGRRIKERKAELLAWAESPDFRPPPVRSLDVGRQPGYSKEHDMNRQYERDRDEQGRFMSEDDRGRYRGGYRGREEEDEYERRGPGRGRGWYGDPGGHSRASEEGWEQRGRGGYSRGRDRDYGDDDNGRHGGGGGPGHGRGWYGDPEGHSRASEEGWEHRGRGGYSRGRDYGDDDNGRHGGGGGPGHGRGWYGDPEGHSRASEEGWEHRGRSGYSRGRDYGDDDRRYSGGGAGGGRGQGHGGWFGDPEGHSRASEEGWEHRGRGGRYSRDR